MSLFDRLRAFVSRRRHGASVGAPTLIIIADACRYDTFAEAYDGRFGDLQKAHSPACWTLPAHEAIVRGNLPTPPEKGPRDAFDNSYPDTYIPLPRLHEHSWMVAEMPYLHSGGSIDSPVPRYFDTTFESSHGDTGTTAKVACGYATHERSWFGLVNFGATHFPYQRFEGEFEAFLDAWDADDVTEGDLREWQTDAAAEVIDAAECIASSCPDGTNIVLTADHGELFGEKGGFGHNYGERAEFDDALHAVPLVSWTVGESRGGDVRGDVADGVGERLAALGYRESASDETSAEVGTQPPNFVPRERGEELR